MYFESYRRDARYLPHVTRATNPFEKEEPGPVQDNRVIPGHTTLPSEEWRMLLVTRFRNFRQVSNIGNNDHALILVMLRRI